MELDDWEFISAVGIPAVQVQNNGNLSMLWLQAGNIPPELKRKKEKNILPSCVWRDQFMVYLSSVIRAVVLGHWKQSSLTAPSNRLLLGKEYRAKCCLLWQSVMRKTGQGECVKVCEHGWVSGTFGDSEMSHKTWACKCSNGVHWREWHRATCDIGAPDTSYQRYRGILRSGGLLSLSSLLLDLWKGWVPLVSLQQQCPKQLLSFNLTTFPMKCSWYIFAFVWTLP